MAAGPLAGVAQAQAQDEAAQSAITSPGDEAPHHVRRHYLWSNERRHDLFFGDLKDLGGGYMGVGGDQNYTLAAAAGSSVMWLIDLDSAVVYMHRLYAALLAISPTPKDFLAKFERGAQRTVHDAVQARYPDEAERRLVLEGYHAYRDLLRDHLRSASHGRRGSNWLADPAKYAHIRDLAMRGRLVARLGDLTGTGTVLAIADAAKRAAIPIRAVYLSNAESWFRYGEEFRRNFTALPFDDKSVIVRTVKSELLGYPSGDIWHYTIQLAQNFSKNLGNPSYKSIDVTMTDAVLSKKAGISHVGFPIERGMRPVLAQNSTAGRETRRSLMAAGLVTRPEGNRERANEMDRDRMRRAALELARSGTP